MTAVYWHLSDGWWDTALPRWLLDAAVPCQHVIGIENAAFAYVGVICIPGRHSVEHVEQINEAAKHFEKCLFFLYGDEEGIFPEQKLKHGNCSIWWAMPPYGREFKANSVVINGWPTDAQRLIAKYKVPERVRDYDWSFAGQVTHNRREECQRIASGLPRGCFYATPGFTQGMPRENYYLLMNRSKFVLCPGGPCTVDTFRIAEALEAGAIPIADDKAKNPLFPPGYWNYVFGENDLPFPIVEDWQALPRILKEWLADYPERKRACRTWWSRKKLEWVEQMRRV
jgi:hypothetical protein